MEFVGQCIFPQCKIPKYSYLEQRQLTDSKFGKSGKLEIGLKIQYSVSVAN